MFQTTNQQKIFRLPCGKASRNYGSNHHFDGKNHDFDWAMFNSKLLVYQRVTFDLLILTFHSLGT